MRQAHNSEKAKDLQDIFLHYACTCPTLHSRYLLAIVVATGVLYEKVGAIHVPRK